MISLKELNPKGYQTTDEQSANLATLLDRMNQIRTAWGKPMVVTSGLRTADDQRRIYSQKAQAAGQPAIRVPMGSAHLSGAACDILDEDGSLKAWVLNNVSLLETVGLWCEDFKSTPNWCHFQVYAPRSGKRFFIP